MGVSICILGDFNVILIIKTDISKIHCLWSDRRNALAALWCRVQLFWFVNITEWKDIVLNPLQSCKTLASKLLFFYCLCCYSEQREGEKKSPTSLIISKELQYLAWKLWYICCPLVQDPCIVRTSKHSSSADVLQAQVTENSMHSASHNGSNANWVAWGD